MGPDKLFRETLVKAMGGRDGLDEDVYVGLFYRLLGRCEGGVVQWGAAHTNADAARILPAFDWSRPRQINPATVLHRRSKCGRFLISRLEKTDYHAGFLLRVPGVDLHRGLDGLQRPTEEFWGVGWGHSSLTEAKQAVQGASDLLADYFRTRQFPAQVQI